MSGQIEYRSYEWANWVPFWCVGKLSTVLIGGQIEYRSAEWENWVPFWWVGKLNTVLLSGQIEYRSDVWANWVPFWWVGKLSTVLLSGQIEYRSAEWANWVPFLWAKWGILSSPSLSVASRSLEIFKKILSPPPLSPLPITKKNIRGIPLQIEIPSVFSWKLGNFLEYKCILNKKYKIWKKETMTVMGGQIKYRSDKLAN